MQVPVPLTKEDHSIMVRRFRPSTMELDHVFEFVFHYDYGGNIDVMLNEQVGYATNYKGC